jgi:1-acyl-sn-glycerol-3-phosphate acyltransferase
VPRWGRRLVTFTAVVVAFAALLALSPGLLVLCAIADVVQRARFAAVRSLLMVLFYLACEIAGLVAAGALWLRVVGEPAVDANFRLQWWWASALFSAARALFGLRVEVTGEDAVRGGPVLVLARHVSVADTLLPSALVSRPYGLRLRYVLKQELQWDPCIDVVGGRLPMAFVLRGSRDNSGDVAAVRQLAEGLGERDGVLIFPEGTRATPARRARVLAKLEASPSTTPEQLADARRLAHLLPPRLDGVLALLEADERADVVFLAHAGLERVRTLADIRRGRMVGESIQIHFWRCPRREVPADREERIRWLTRQWQAMDDWVGATEPRERRS